MMTLEDVAFLLEDSTRELIERRKGEDPTQVALREPQRGALIATQVKYLQRARTKLPSLYEANCIIPPLAFEQSSSEATSSLRQERGGVCIDLTCGLGVDALALSRGFERVIALERDPVLARVVQANLQRLVPLRPEAARLEVVNTSAEEFVESFEGEVDLIYVDPARRGEAGERLFRLESCSPNVVELMPRLLEIAPRVLIKASPLFEVEQAFRLFAPQVSVEVVSLHDECKEVLIEVRREGAPFAEASSVRATALGVGSLNFDREDREERVQGCTLPSDQWRYLLLPDVSLYKSRCWGAYATQLRVYAPTPTGYGFSHERPEGFMGRIYRIEELHPYQPKVLKRMLAQRGMTRCTLLKRDFSMELGTIMKALGISSGSQQLLALTQIHDERYFMLLTQ